MPEKQQLSIPLEATFASEEAEALFLTKIVRPGVEINLAHTLGLMFTIEEKDYFNR